MTSFTQSFLQDLEDLEDDEPQREEQMEEEEPNLREHAEAVAELEMMKYNKPSGEYLNLAKDVEFLNNLKKIETLMAKPLGDYLKPITYGDEEYDLIIKSNQFISLLDRDIGILHKGVRDIYIAKFPELESLIIGPVEYCRCVMKIGNETDLGKLDFGGFLSNHLVVAITVAGSSTSGKALEKAQLDEALRLCELVLMLDGYKRTILQYIESRMQWIAPNLSAVVGTTVAALLMGAAGGIEELSRIPACNVQVLGTQRKNNLGFAKNAADNHLGFFGQLEIVQKSAPAFRRKLVRILATNAAKAVRFDLSRQAPTGELGAKLREALLARFAKIQEPAPAKMKKPLPRPDDKPRKKRGGRKYRNMRMKKAMTELRKHKNRLKFGTEGEQEYGMTGKGFGMLGFTGKVKVAISKGNKLNLSKRQKKDLAANLGGKALGGATTSIVFTPTEGLEMKFLDEAFPKPAPKADNYFSEEGGFRTVLAEAKKKSSVGGFIPH